MIEKILEPFARPRQATPMFWGSTACKPTPSMEPLESVELIGAGLRGVGSARSPCKIVHRSEILLTHLTFECKVDIVPHVRVEAG